MPNPFYTYTVNIYDLIWWNFMAYQPLKVNAKSCLYIRGVFNKFPDFFVQAFKIVVDS